MRRLLWLAPLAVVAALGGCRRDCDRLCARQAACQREAAARAGIEDLEADCQARCEQTVATEAGRQAVKASLACVSEDCEAMTRCLAGSGATR